jgi:hypothetical protein
MSFRNRQQLRRWAARVLLLWLFGVAAGVANACLGPGPGALASPATAPAQHVGAGHHDGMDGGRAHGQDLVLAFAHGGGAGHEGSRLRSNCVDFCDKASVSIPPLKSPLDDLQGQALLVAPVAVVQAGPAGLPAQRWDPRQQVHWSPPIRIVFLRLVL